MPIKITYPMIVKALQNAIDDRGEEYVYQYSDDGMHTCQNWHQEDQEPGCIVGYVLYGLNVPEEILWERNNAQARDLIDTLVARSVVTFESDEEKDKVSALLGVVQGHQDGLTPWGLSVEHGLAYMKKEGLARD